MRLLVAGDPTGGRTLPPAAQSPYGQGEPASPATNSLAHWLAFRVIDLGRRHKITL